MDLDPVGEKIYWTARDDGAGVIGQANLDGSSSEQLLLTGSDLPISIAVDGPGGKMYWTSEASSAGSDSKVMRANLDGSAVEVLVVNADNSPRAIDLDLVNGNMYWIENGLISNDPPLFGGSVRRATLTGANQVTIGIAAGPFGGSAKGVAVDMLNSKVYWSAASDCVPCDDMLRTDLDGANSELIVSQAFHLGEIAVAPVAGLLYWSEIELGSSAWIRRSGLDGSNVTTVLVLPVGASDVTLDPSKHIVPAMGLPGAMLAAALLGLVATLWLRRRLSGARST